MQTLLALLPYLVGPAGAVVSLAVVLYGVHHFFVVRLWPAIERWMERHLSQIDQIIQRHSEDMAAVRDSIAHLARRIDDLVDERSGAFKRPPPPHS